MKTVTFNGVIYTCTLSARFRRHTPEELARIRETACSEGIRTAVRLYRDTDLALDNCVLDGEGRLSVAADLGLPKVPFYYEPAMGTDAAFQSAKTLNDCRRHDDPETVRRRKVERIERVRAARSAPAPKSLRAIATDEGVSVAQVVRDLGTGSVPYGTSNSDDGQNSLVPYGTDSSDERENAGDGGVVPGGTDDDSERPRTDRRPAWMRKGSGGNKADPDHPYAEILAAFTNLARLVTVAMNDPDDGGRLLQTLTLHSQTTRRTLMVLYSGARFVDGETKDAKQQFVGLRPLRALVRAAGKAKKPLNAKQIASVFDAANDTEGEEE